MGFHPNCRREWTEKNQWSYILRSIIPNLFWWRWDKGHLVFVGLRYHFIYTWNHHYYISQWGSFFSYQLEIWLSGVIRIRFTDGADRRYCWVFDWNCLYVRFGCFVFKLRMILYRSMRISWLQFVTNFFSLHDARKCCNIT